MKKYIIPASRVYELHSRGTILVNSNNYIKLSSSASMSGDAPTVDTESESESMETKAENTTSIWDLY